MSFYLRKDGPRTERISRRPGEFPRSWHSIIKRPRTSFVPVYLLQRSAIRSVEILTRIFSRFFEASSRSSVMGLHKSTRATSAVQARGAISPGSNVIKSLKFIHASNELSIAFQDAHVDHNFVFCLADIPISLWASFRSWHTEPICRSPSRSFE